MAKHDRPTIVDTEAGLEHLSRGTTRHVDCMLIVIEPYFKSLETGARIQELTRELGIGQIYGVANKIRGSEDEEAIHAFCKKRNVELLSFIPYDESLIEADRIGLAPIDYDANGIAVQSIGNMLEKLINLNR